jgi:predicted xylan-binding protein with Ca-dependent carbohydrate-binding module
VITGKGNDVLTLTVCEDAYANGDGTSNARGDAAFTVSIDGKQLAGTYYATASGSAGASQSFAFMGDWAPGSHVVAVSFLNDAWGGTSSTDRNLFVTHVAYDGSNIGQIASLYGNGVATFNVSDTTALPTAPTGYGNDTLILKMSEDAFQGNAQFTVLMDGKQLGGTFTTTALHSPGSSQSFVFKGDFGAGQHALAINFTNDLWLGTPSTDRNLYVNGIVYNGTDTGQSANLTPTKTFALSGGTAPLVSETGDHGSLSKNLSQTGTYLVGGDTFVLSSAGNVSAVLGGGTSQIRFVGAATVSVTGGTGKTMVSADTGSGKFVAGTGSLDVTGGPGGDAYVFHAGSGLMTLENFSIAKGDTLTIDKSLQASIHQASDGLGGTMITFGTDTAHGMHAIGSGVLAATSIHWA